MDLATLAIKVDATGAVRSVRELNKELDATKQEADGVTESAGKMGLAMKAAAAAGGVLLIGAMKKVVDESVEAQYAQAQLTAALKSTAAASGQSIRSLNAHAAALQRMTTFSDEAVSSAQAILLTFTKIGGDAFPKATQAVLDLATRMGGDLKGAALQVGKALNDPIDGMSALTRSGIQFTDAQKALVKGFMETNDLAAAQTVILKELETQFGGSAAAARNTLGGAINALKLAFGELFEIDAGQSSTLIRTLNGMVGLVERLNIALGGLNDIATRLGILDATAPTMNGQTPLQITTARDRARFGSMGAAPITITATRPERLTPLAAGRQPLRALPAPGRQADRMGGAGNSAKGLAETILTSDKGAMADKLRALTDAAREMADSAAMVTENFLRGVQGTFTSFFRDLFTNGVSSFRGLMDSFKNLVINAFAELAAKRLMGSLFGEAGVGGLLGGLSGGAMLGIGVGAFALSRLFGGDGARKGYKKPPGTISARPNTQANDMMPRGSEIRSSVGSALQEGTAVRLFGTFEAMRQSLVNIEGLLRNGALMGNGTSSSGLDKALGVRSQSLRLAAGVAVVG